MLLGRAFLNAHFMLLNNASNSANVDMADGYSFLPFVEPQIAFRGAKWTPAEVSVVLHEFTHQLALKGPFGWLCAYHQTMRAQLQEMAHTEVSGSSHMNLKPSETFDFKSILARLSTNDLGNCTDLFNVFRYWLEGIAMFTQLNFQISQKYMASSAVHELLLALWNTDLHRHDRETPIPVTAPEMEGTFTQIEPSIASMTDIVNLVREVNLSQFDGLRSLFLTCPEPAHEPYFAGYQLVLRIQRLLEAKDPRLADPEVFYIFINSCLFFDARLLELCRTLPRNEYQGLLSQHLAEKVQLLVDVSVANLRMTVSAICDYENAEVNFAHLDVSTSLRTGILASWGLPSSKLALIRSGIKEAVRRRCNGEGAVFCQILHQQGPTYEEYQVNTSVELMNTLLVVMKYFKLHHNFIGVLGCNVNDEACQLTWQSLDGTSAMFGESLPRSSGIELQKIAREHSFELAIETRLTPSLTTAFKEDGLRGMHREMMDLGNEGKLLTLEVFEAYSLLSNQRVRIRFRDSFYHVWAYYKLAHVAGKHGDVSREEAQMLEGARGYLSPRNYYDKINLPPDILHEHASSDKDFVSREALLWWRQLFPDAVATDKDLRSLTEQKLGLLCLQPEDHALVHGLCAAATIPASSEHLATAVRLNKRWRYYTGENLIMPAKEDPSHLSFSF